ncbi:3'a2rel-related protein [Trypanosoma rangeli]|uniref:3'a2rel-related protein n=1 Tax=Trypanosoma rangeli TaxID=5698 RepID=A0A3R7KC53_TRYRA|nr:3'a2rel-related protein [Trypanosoma rangeli]RNF03556.1 3'a2rel-related protein [Trypanosoma rangeli]|eukprot:RNF03556.1 3'a2rel-related protein [Trypanosoma rangeli]
MDPLQGQRYALSLATADPPKHDKKDDSDRLLLLLLLLLIFPAGFLMYILIRCCRKYRYRCLARKIKLWGSRHSGDVDTPEIDRAIGGGEWLTDRKRLEGDATDNKVALLDVSKPAEKFDPILDEAEKHKKRWQRYRNLGDAEINNTDEFDAEKEAAADVTDGSAAPQASGNVGAYDAATTRVWLKTLVGETNVDADGLDVADKAGVSSQASAAEQSGKAGISHQIYRVNSGCGQQAQFPRGRTISRGFDEMLATLAPPEALSGAFHDKNCIKRESPLVVDVVVAEKDEFAEDKDEKEAVKESEEEDKKD